MVFGSLINERSKRQTQRNRPPDRFYTCDYMGHRHTRKITVNGNLLSHLRYIYRGYLQITAIDAQSGSFQWFLLWDPTQPSATRPLAIRKDGTWYCYGWDITKNICEIFGPSGYIRTTYSYTPFGQATTEGDVSQPIQWSSEMHDDQLGLVYYNYRHYNPSDGRWLNRDPIDEHGGWNLYAFVRNVLVSEIDLLGLKKYCKINGQNVVLTFDGVSLKGAGIDIMAVSGVPFECKIIKTLPGSGWFMNDTYITHRLVFDYSKNNQKKKNIGPIPEGEWELYVDKTNDKTNALRHKSFNIVSQQAWGKSSWHLIPGENTNISTEIPNETRDNIFLHGGCKPGSKGCIDSFDGGEIIIKKLVDQIN